MSTIAVHAPVRWGFLGAGFVASAAMAPAVHAADGAVLQVVAARDIERAHLLAPVRATTSYEAVIAADDVDAIYISLTNEAHERWVVAALTAGKHVLCEKPLAMTQESGEHMAAAALHSHLIEALWYRWHPRYARTMELLDAGEIGALTAVEARFCFSGVPSDNYRLDPARGGGALLDVGPYVLDASLSAISSARHRPITEMVVAARNVVVGNLGGRGNVDLSLEASLRVDSIDVALEVSIDQPPQQVFNVSGETGTLTWSGDEVFTVWKQPSRLAIETKGVVRFEDFAAVDPYQTMVEQSMRVMNGAEPSLMPLRDSVRLAMALDLLRDQ